MFMKLYTRPFPSIQQIELDTHIAFCMQCVSERNLCAVFFIINNMKCEIERPADALRLQINTIDYGVILI